MTVRELALQALFKYDTEGDYVRETLDGLLRQARFEARDRALATELVYGTVRWRGRIDWVIQQFVKRVDGLTPWIINNLRLGIYQILMLDHIPDSAATNETVELAKRYGHAGTVKLTNAVLRNIIRKRNDIEYPGREDDPALSVSTRHSYPLWLTERWIGRYGLNGAEALCESGNQAPPLSVRVNRLKVSPEELMKQLENSGAKVRPGRYLEEFLELRGAGSVKNLPGFSDGSLQVQDESAGLAVKLLDPQPGETVLDLCCAPGGKTAFIAELMEGRGVIIGADLVPARLKRLQEHCKRMGIGHIFPVAMDGKSCSLRRPVDRVLIDAPCTGLGTVARRTELRWRRNEADIASAARHQREILEHGADLVKVGGVVVYSTCTIEPEENVEVVRDFCRSHPEFTVDPPSEGPVTGVLDGAGMVNTLPSIHGVDGSFAVRLRRGK